MTNHVYFARFSSLLAVKRAIWRRWITSWAAAILAMALSCQAAAADPASADRQAMMRRIAESWLASQQADGLLPYGYDFLADRVEGEPSSGEYIVREAAAFYVWAEYYRYSRDDRFREPIRKGIAAFEQRSLAIGKSRSQEVLEATRMLSLP